MRTIGESLQLFLIELVLLHGDDGAVFAMSNRVHETHAGQGHIVVAAGSTKALATSTTMVLEKSY